MTVHTNSEYDMRPNKPRIAPELSKMSMALTVD